MSSELYRVSGNGEVSVRVDARVRLVDEVNRYPLRRRKRQRWWIELRMKAANGNHEVGVVTIGKQQTHLARKRDEQNVRIEQGGEEIEALLIELEGSGEVDL